MNDAPETNPPEVTLSNIAARIEELTREVRRQGRAAVAAQAAAESCLEHLTQQDDGKDEEEDEGDDDEAPAPETHAWVRALLPVADSLDRIVAQTSSMLEQRKAAPPPPPPPPRGLLSWLAPPPPPPPPPPSRDTEIAALAEGLRVLRAQLGEALSSRGVRVDRRTGVAIDPLIHRVVETRPLRPGERADVVLEVVRPGYSAGDSVVREAEIVAGADPKQDH